MSIPVAQGIKSQRAGLELTNPPGFTLRSFVSAGAAYVIDEGAGSGDTYFRLVSR